MPALDHVLSGLSKGILGGGEGGIGRGGGLEDMGGGTYRRPKPSALPENIRGLSCGRHFLYSPHQFSIRFPPTSTIVQHLNPGVAAYGG